MILLIMTVVVTMPMIMIIVVILLRLHSCLNHKFCTMISFFVNYNRQRMSMKDQNLMNDMYAPLLICYYTLMMADFIKDGGVSSNLQQK